MELRMKSECILEQIKEWSGWRALECLGSTKWSWSVASGDRLLVENFRGDASRVKRVSRSHAFHEI